ncbi:hypothetical protein L798_08612 [Zootermopsis nevadensis]|uniref:Ionotropic receptor 75a N-terminal domain-containing protein n=1 Tax=Zootermopsis nevadensis TaxID=136037 RepID=A0A067RAW9_ZOONE|nr:hypothetical protein L798_08612 [Zootermopsis nevadensis]
MSKATWLLFVDTKLLLEEVFLDINIPFDCEFLVVQEEGDNAALLTEVYRVKSALPLQTRFFGTWTSRDGLTWPNLSLYQRRDSLQGIALKTAFLRVSIYSRLILYSRMIHYSTHNYFHVSVVHDRSKLTQKKLFVLNSIASLTS